MEQLHAFGYTSRATNSLGDEELVRLLDGARRFNEQNAITGKLIAFRDEAGSVRAFAQWIEGPFDALQACTERIHSDDLHVDIQIEWSGSVRERRFSDWSMWLEDAPQSDSDEHERHLFDPGPAALV